MPPPVQNFSRLFRSECHDKAATEQPRPAKHPKVTRATSTRNVLRKKPPMKFSRQVRISEPTIIETSQGNCEPENICEATPSCQVEASHVLPELQARRVSRRHSGHPMPLASHPDTMSFVSAPPRVSLPDLSRVPCFNSYSITHNLKCGHAVRAPIRKACGRNCDSVRGHELHGAAAKEPFICQACINNLLDVKYKQKRERFMQGLCPTWPFLGTRVDGIAQKTVKKMEDRLDVERAKDERALVKLGRYSYATNYT